MSPFTSGSAWAMARDIAHGHVLVTDRTFDRLSVGEVQQLSFELERYTRELRSEQPALDDTAALRTKNQKLSRLVRVGRMINAWRHRKR